MTDPAMTLLLTRPRAQAARFAQAFGQRFGGQIPICLSPILEIRPKGALPPLDRAEGLIFTSANGVRAFADQSDNRRFFAYCVGARTAQAARDAGLQAEVMGEDAAGLVAALLARRPAGPLIHLRGEHARGQVAQKLRDGGLACREAVVYAQIPQELSAGAQDLLAGLAPVLLPLFSPRSAVLMAEAAADATAPLYVAAMSAAVEAAWTGPSARLVRADRPDADAMLEALGRLIAAVPRLEGGQGPG